MTDVARRVVLIIGHGSRVPEAVAQFNEFAAALAERAGQPVRTCFLELADPDMAAGLSDAAGEAGDGGEVVVLPLFLGAAAHQKNDVPAAIGWARGQFPGVSFRYGMHMGLHAGLIDLLDLRVRESMEADADALPPGDTIVLVVGRGSSDPNANGEVAKIAHLLFEGRPYRGVEYAFQAVAHPTVEEGMRRCSALGARQVVVAPYIFFTGRVDEDIRGVSGHIGAGLGLRVLHAGYLGIHPLLLDVAAQRMREAMEGDVTVNCDLCKYRFPMAGYEGQVGMQQTTHHLHGGSAHAHDHDHDHDHHHHGAREVQE